MRLWTIQTEEAWRQMQEMGCLRADAAYMDQDFIQPYVWMAEQMERCIGPRPKGVEYPVWGWYQWAGENRARPDLRASAHLPKGRRGVRIEFEIAGQLVLLSDFDLWHFPLNYWYLPASEQDDKAFEEEL